MRNLLVKRRVRDGLAFGVAFGLLACGGESREALLEAATESVAEAAQAVGEAQAELALRDEELARAEQARTEAQAAFEEAEQRLREAETTLGLHATDEVLFRSVQKRLLEERDLRDVAIAARVQEGVVTLTGDAVSERVRDAAVETARAVPGVREVRSELRIAAPEAAR